MSPSTNKTLTGSSLYATHSCLLTDFCWASQRTTSRPCTIGKHTKAITISEFDGSTISQTGSRALTPVTLLLNGLSMNLLLLSLDGTSLNENSNIVSWTTRRHHPAREKPPPYCFIHLPVHPLLQPSTASHVVVSAFLHSSIQAHHLILCEQRNRSRLLIID